MPTGASAASGSASARVAPARTGPAPSPTASRSTRCSRNSCGAAGAAARQRADRRQGGGARDADRGPVLLEAARGGKREVALADGRSVEVTIPAGIEAGQKLRLRDAQAGDVCLEIAVEPHPLFTRKDRDIHVELPVTLAEAVLGATITVPTIHGAVAVKVPKGSNSGATCCGCAARASPRGGANGDQYVKLRVMLPDPPDPELSEFLERWARRHAQGVRGDAV